MARRRAGKRQVGYAVIGSGQSAVLAAFEHARNARLVAIVSPDEEERRRLARRHGCDAYALEELDACLARPDLDAVYFAGRTARHADLAVRCARAGADVLCDAPLGISEEECRRMIDASRDAGVQLTTAYRLQFEPASREAARLIEQGRIGEPRFLSATFVQVRPGAITAAERGGGALWELGANCIHTARSIFRADPVELFALRAERPGDARFGELHDGMSVQLRFPEGRLAQFTVSFGSSAQDHCRIVGTRGHVQLDQGTATGARKLRVSTGGKERVRTFRAGSPLAAGLQAFSRAVLGDQPVEPGVEEGLRDVRVVVAALRSARENRPLTLSWPAPQRPLLPADRIDQLPAHHPRLVAGTDSQLAPKLASHFRVHFKKMANGDLRTGHTRR